MISRLLTKNYIFGFLVLLGAMLLLLIRNAGAGSPMLFMALRLLIGAFLILLFFDLLKLGLVDEKNSYRTMLMERPLFNPRGKKDELTMLYPLHPRFIAVFIDHEDDNPYDTTVYSIQALRYEHGYFSDALFLPIRKEADQPQGRLLAPEDATRLLTTYSKGFPLVVYARDFAAVWLRDQSNSVLLTEAIDTQEIARLIYPKLTDYGIEDINDWLRFEVDEGDPVYGARITAAVYLDYLRLHGYDTTLTVSPFARETELKSIYPEELATQGSMEGWEKAADEPTPGPSLMKEEDPAEGPETAFPENRYIGPFTPIDEEGFEIPERGHLVPKEED